VVDVGELAGPATLGDCKGDWTGAGLVSKSIFSGGRSGVLACPWSSASSGGGLSASKADEMASLKLSSRFVRAGEGRREPSCFEIPLTAGLMSREEPADPVCDPTWSEWVIIESRGPAADLCFHLFDKEGKRVANRPLTPGSEKSPDRCFFEDGRGESLSEAISQSNS
jgi:hypothetical protein